ncbi:MAG: acyl-CoA reductase [Chitinophagaceae bacterium]|nr:MAG: acyl-CoA reductase [Chitinophagaceae bacterium]
MDLKEKIELLGNLRAFLEEKPAVLKEGIRLAGEHNKWFTEDNVNRSLGHIAQKFLNEDALLKWTDSFKDKIPNEKPSKKLALIMAGNIPLVGFHDFLAGFIANYTSVIKMSSKDKFLWPIINDFLKSQNSEIADYIHFSERISSPDAIIATGDDNTHRYFEYYFSKYPHILRKNRNSVAFLDGTESDEQLKLLSDDVFTYFGLGCRNITNVLIPEDYDVTKLLDIWEDKYKLSQHTGYLNNFDYHRSLLLLSKREHLVSDFLILYEDASLSSPVSCLHYQKYKNIEHGIEMLNNFKDGIQCIAGENEILREKKLAISFGKTQFPELDDYADGQNTLEFLIKNH